jgi:hypothetical protein
MEPSGFAVFCDDIRQEVGGKVSLIGCYGAEMLVEDAFPTDIAKLGVFVRLFIPSDAIPKEIKVEVFLPQDSDEPSGQIVSDIPPLQATLLADPALTKDPSKKKKLGLSWNFHMGPLELEKAGLIRVQALLDGTRVRLGTLRISKLPEASL